MQYYYAKIGKGNIYAEAYLKGENELKAPAIPIYYDCAHGDRESFLEHGGAGNQALNFFNCGDNPEDTIIVVINGGIVNLLKPIGIVSFHPSTVNTEKRGFVKLLPVKIIKQTPLAEVPAILAGITANRHYSSGTFREVTNIGNIISIEAILGKQIETPCAKDITDALVCLGSFEFETLVAKIFEEAGFFVPGYRGGNMQGADLFAHNKTRDLITVSNISVPAGKSISIQVKLSSIFKNPPPGIDYLIKNEIFSESDRCFGATWLTLALSSSCLTMKWLAQSLDWVPQSYLDSSKLASLLPKVEKYQMPDTNKPVVMYGSISDRDDILDNLAGCN